MRGEKREIALVYHFPLFLLLFAIFCSLLSSPFRNDRDLPHEKKEERRKALKSTEFSEVVIRISVFLLYIETRQPFSPFLCQKMVFDNHTQSVFAAVKSWLPKFFTFLWVHTSLFFRNWEESKLKIGQSPFSSCRTNPPSPSFPACLPKWCQINHPPAPPIPPTPSPPPREPREHSRPYPYLRSWVERRRRFCKTFPPFLSRKKRRRKSVLCRCWLIKITLRKKLKNNTRAKSAVFLVAHFDPFFARLVPKDSPLPPPVSIQKKSCHGTLKNHPSDVKERSRGYQAEKTIGSDGTGLVTTIKCNEGVK